MRELLEKRLEIVSSEEFESLKRALLKEHINPKENYKIMPHLKKDLCKVIAKRIHSNDDFESNLYSGQINKEPLKRTYYGILSTDTQVIPRTFFQALNFWERVYFFTGRWNIIDPDFSDDLPTLTVKHLKEGLNCLYKKHYIKKANEEYNREIQLPGGTEVREAYKRIIKKQVKPIILPPIQQFLF
ncbi:MAG TPA: hypothetical protein P5277_00035 [Candidatus Paceibacterota bacterium]|nr:hypothetical protein [Candidatus Paceibacterota bacterium]